MSKRHVSLHDKYEAGYGRAFVTGIQALVRLPLDQRRADRAAGLNTAGFISGYRGSPLGGYDQQLHRASAFLDAENIVFREGVNEDLAATAVWGSQQVGLFPGARADGVFGLWYGKAPGVDRTGDVFKHANFAGVSPLGGVLAVAGDDHACKSSTLPSQSEFAFADAEVPVLNPAGVQEVLDYGLYGWALSRFSGLWCGLIALADTMDSSAVIEVGAGRLSIVKPDFDLPAGGLGLRRADEPMAKERRLRLYKIPAAQAFVRANRLDRVVLQSPAPRLGIVSTGQGALDVFEALENLGLPPDRAAGHGITVFKVAMPWPLETEALRGFARGLEEILFVEHKRALIEPQAKAALYNLAQRPRLVGKADETGAPLLSQTGALTIPEIAAAIYARLPHAARTEQAEAYFARVARSLERAKKLEADVHRLPHFCSGCPHNTSTVVPEGSRALAGIGCHYMATFSGRADMTSQMGGEGAAWIGQAPFTDEDHLFVNLGDGTYSHSGSLTIRAAVAAGVNITYKLLYNGAVAMTGGQAVETGLSVADIVFQLKGEKVAKIAIVADDISRYATIDLGGVRVSDRAKLDEVQRQLRDVKGVTVLIYDQVCAAEQRRKVKRGLVAPRRTRVFINADVCEGCGDCSVQSNCLSIEPLETELGTKRQINQNSCNLDTSCVKGFCPSFVTVEGAVDAHRSHVKPAIPKSENLPEPAAVSLDQPFNLLFAGVGGTGVTTIAAIIGMAAHIDGNAATTLDMAGLAQKGGAVLSHIRIASRPEDVRSARTPTAAADAVIAGDLIVAANTDALALFDSERTRAVANWDVAPTSEFLHDRNKRFDSGYLQRRVEKACASVEGLNAEALAAEYFYDSVFANTILLGYAWARGLVPVSLEALTQSIRLNGAGVAENLAAFDLGRAYAHEPARFEPVIPARARPPQRPLDDLIAHRAGLLAAYQDEKYAQAYRDLLAYVREKEAGAGLGEKFQRAVATYAYKLMAYKDEYEVARLYTDGRWAKSLRAAFTGDLAIHFHLAPPFLSGAKDALGRPRKRKFGFWMFYAFKLLAAMKGLRGSAFDPFARTEERERERALRDEYMTAMRLLADELTPAAHDLAVRLAELPDMIRGYGPVKAEGMAKAKTEEKRLRAALALSRRAASVSCAAE